MGLCPWRWRRIKAIKQRHEISSQQEASCWLSSHIFAFLVMLFSFTLLPGCYVVTSAFSFNNLYNSRKPVSEALHDPELSQVTRSRLKQLDSILKFARANGLQTAGAYKYYVDLQADKHVTYTVQAVEALRFKAKTWWFPVVGKVPYLGFFEKAQRDAKALELRKQNFDINKGEAYAFSSLGWFDDPVYSYMLSTSLSSLANVVFHELVHRTLWVEDEVLFNEQLATYIADVLTIQYLQSLSLKNDLDRYFQKKSDRELFSKWLTALKRELEKLYANKRKEDSDTLLTMKKSIFHKYLGSLKPRFALIDYVANNAEEDESSEGGWNNATIMASNLYSPQESLFAEPFVCVGGDVTAFMKALKKALSVQEDPQQALKGLCKLGTQKPSAAELGKEDEE